MNQLAMPQKGETVALMHTNMGDISIRLFPEQAPKTAKPVTAKEPDQMVIPGMNASVTGTDPVIDFLNKQKIPYVDKRSKNGSLWLVGGPELAGIVKQCNSLGLKFAYTANGSKATKGKPGWYSKK